MHPFITIGILLIMDLILFKYTGFWGGLLLLEFIIYKISKILGITNKRNFFRILFVEGVAFTKDYIGSYNEINDYFLKLKKIISTFNLKDFYIISIFYDIPYNYENPNIRCSMGLYKKNLGQNQELLPKEFEKYCFENGFNKNELPGAISLYNSWEYCNEFTMKLGIQNFYKTLIENINDKNFLKALNIKDKLNINQIIELYESDKLVSFYVPLEFTDKFLIFKGTQ